ncbi:MAG: hypothetical protein QXV83_03950 [Candidatus Anstonellaceae archaeon]
MFDLDFSSLENSIIKKSKKDLLDAIRNLELENQKRQKLLFLSSGNFLVSIMGKPFLKKYATISFKKIFVNLYSYLDQSFPDYLKNIKKYALNSDFQNIEKLFLEIKNSEEEFSRLLLQFLIYYDICVLFSLASTFYNSNGSVLLHFIKKIEDQYEIDRLYILPQKKLLNIHEALENLVDVYFKKINKTTQT